MAIELQYIAVYVYDLHELWASDAVMVALAQWLPGWFGWFPLAWLLWFSSFTKKKK